MTRKEFIKNGGRLIILTGLAVGAGVLVARRKVTGACQESTACIGCGQFDGCRLPQAEETRQKITTCCPSGVVPGCCPEMDELPARK